jgi:FMN-dependent NADH-azoreductase
MKEILFINACVRPQSRTLELAKSQLEKTEGEIQRLDLYDTQLKPLDAQGIAFREQASKEQDFSNEVFDLAKQFANADAIVIAAPYWDLLFPAVLRTYLETVCVSGLTFRYTQEGRPLGLCKAKKAYYVTTAGGFIGENNFGFMYVKALFQQLFGIEQVEFISKEGLDII